MSLGGRLLPTTDQHTLLLTTAQYKLTTNHLPRRLSPSSAAPSRDIAPSGLRRSLAAARRDGARGPEADTGGVGEAGVGGELGEVVGGADGAGGPGAVDNPLALAFARAFAPSSDREHSAVDSEEGE